MESEAALGEEYHCTLTQFTGTATARATYLHGPVKVELTRADKNGKPEAVWFPEPQLALGPAPAKTYPMGMP